VTLPAWLIAHLDATGRANPDGVTRAARAASCPRCHAATLAGLDGDLAAMPARVNDYEIDETGEFLALAQGIPTYSLTLRGGVWHIDGRSLADVRAGRCAPLFAAHRCGMDLPNAREPMLTRQRSHAPTPIDPPF
jgi:hypothetical protein